MRYLGIDYGSKNVGIALSDEGGNIAFPYKALKNTNSLVDDVRLIAEQEGVSTIIVGYSKDDAGKDNPIMGAIRTFCKALEEQGTINVVLVDESMTSAHSRHALDQKPKARVTKRKRTTVDASAAALILQRYLDSTDR